jgi:hypothetical protein
LTLGFGLQWEALLALVAVLLSTGLNLPVKDLIQRARSTIEHPVGIPEARSC